jgi:hypothetical protein
MSAGAPRIRDSSAMDNDPTKLSQTHATTKWFDKRCEGRDSR